MEIENTDSPTIAPTQSVLAGCEFDIDQYLQQCYCGDIESTGIGSSFGGYKYDSNNIMMYFIFVTSTLNFAILSYIVCNVCSGSGGNKSKYSKVKHIDDNDISD